MKFLLALFGLLTATPALAQKLDEQPRTAIMTAFPPEHAALVGRIEQPRTVRVNGVPVTLGQMAGKPVLLVESGVSMVNAAMTTQWLVDRFAVKRILFSGIAGGIDPSLHIGDVVVAADWGQFMESTIAREAPGGFAPIFRTPGNDLPNYGMIFPRDVEVGNEAEAKSWHRAFPADPALLTIARALSSSESLARCADAAAANACRTSPACMSAGAASAAPPSWTMPPIANICSRRSRRRCWTWKARRWHRSPMPIACPSWPSAASRISPVATPSRTR